VDIIATIDEITETVKQLAESTYEAFKLDVCVVNAEKKIIVATDNLQFKINTYIVNNGLISRLIFEEGRNNFIVSTPGFDEICHGCEKYQKACIYKNVVASGIYCNGQLKGVIYVSAITKTQEEILHKNGLSILNFLTKISALLSSRIQETELMQDIKDNSLFMQKVYEKLDKGVITTWQNGEIISANTYIKKFLRMDDDNLVGNKISNIFRNIIIEAPKETKDNLNEAYANVNGKSRYFLYTMHSIHSGRYENINVYFLEDSKSINKISYEINERNNNITLDEIISNDNSIIELKNVIKKVSRTDSTVLLCGETGTGKELFARSIHNESYRKDHPFIVINCGAIPENLIESELFGYEKGSFSGANTHGKHGKFYLADKGTIFLDEVETMSLFMQQKLLRVIERKEIERIGSSTCIPLDVRIVAATNVELEILVERGEFRQDLFHRLNVIGLSIPPLRERGSDPLFLANYFIEKNNIKYNKKILGLSNEVNELFLKYNWKGNIRELQNVIEFIFNLKSNGLIEVENLPISIKNFRKQISSGNYNSNEIMAISTLEQQHIIRALQVYGCTDKKIIEAGNALGLSRSTMYRKIKKYGIKLTTVKSV
jgi:transcriptional regulator with PAS, ATPase and Fis domain